MPYTALARTTDLDATTPTGARDIRASSTGSRATDPKADSCAGANPDILFPQRLFSAHRTIAAFLHPPRLQLIIEVQEVSAPDLQEESGTKSESARNRRAHVSNSAPEGSVSLRLLRARLQRARRNSTVSS